MLSKKRFWNIVFVFVAIFCALFTFRLIFGYITVPSSYSPVNLVGQLFSEQVRSNIASKRYKSASQSGQVVNVDQKYEKVATLQAQSEAFAEDEAKLRQLIERSKAIIQFEQKKGTKGNRTAQFQIGVQPDNFDPFLEQIEKIGSIISKDVSKKDKTNEYRELTAKQQSLEQTKSALLDLKGKGGKIAEFVELENRILQIEDQLQALGVSLGDYDKENEFCTVKYALKEIQKTTISLAQRIKVALEWTVKIYIQLIFIFLAMLGAAYLLLVVYNRLFGSLTKER